MEHVVVSEMTPEIAAMFASLQQQINTCNARLAEAEKQLREKDTEILRLKAIIEKYQKMLFGSSSEKTKYLSTYSQLSLFGFEQEKQDSVTAAPETEIAAHTRTPSKKKRADFIDLMVESGRFPVETEEIDLPETEQYDANGNRLECIGREMVRRTIEVTSQKYSIRILYKKVYATQRDKKTGLRASVKSAEVPPAIIPHSPASASIIADVAQKKFDYDMPLYRQERAMQDAGVPIRRNILANWMILSSEYLTLPWERMRKELLTQSVIHADETPVRVLHNAKGNPHAKLQIWAYASGKSSPVPIACFEYKDNRGSKTPREFLSGYGGCVVSDGYSGYLPLREVERAGCWAHCRRKWFDSLPKEIKLAESKNDRLDKKAVLKMTPDECIQLYLLLLINQLFALESTYETERLTPSQRLERRKAECTPILEEYWGLVDGIENATGKLSEAIVYSKNQREYLMTFMSNGEVEISNNIVENTIRNLTVGRRNWLFCDTEDGAKATALYYSLIVTAKANGLRVHEYIEHVLVTMSQLLNGKKLLSEVEMNTVLDRLMPWSPDMQTKFKAPDPFGKKAVAVG